MVPNRDYYADKHGKLTDDPDKYALQVAVAGVFLDERIAKRFGITDALVSTDEPNAVRRVRTVIEKPEKDSQEPQEPAGADEPKEPEAEPEKEEPKADKKPAAKKEKAKK